MNRPRLNRGLYTLALCSWLGFGGVSGCSKPAPEAVDQPEPEMTEAEKEASREAARLKTIENRLKTARERLRQNIPIETLFGELEALRASAIGTSLEAETQKLVDEQREKFAALAQAEYDKLVPEVDRLIAAGDFYDADSLLGSFDYDRFAEDPLLGEQPVIKVFKAKRAEIKLFERANNDAGVIRDRARKFHQEGDLVRAIAVLETFSNRYDKTVPYKEIREQIREYLVEYRAEKAKQAELLAVDWVEMDIYSLQPHGADGIFTEIAGGWQGQNNTDGNAQIVGGEDGWLDWFLEFEVKVGGEELDLGIRFKQNRRTNRREYVAYKVPLPSEEWVRLRIEVKDAHARLIRVEGDNAELIETVRLRAPDGGFAFLLPPASSVSVRNFRHKVFRANDAAAEEGAEEGSGG